MSLKCGTLHSMCEQLDTSFLTVYFIFVDLIVNLIFYALVYNMTSRCIKVFHNNPL